MGWACLLPDASALYQPDYHGKVFTLSEILLIVEEKGFPEEEWEFMLPSNIGSYIEAQVWNQKPLYKQKGQQSSEIIPPR